jgi:hypothetical protein
MTRPLRPSAKKKREKRKTHSPAAARPKTSSGKFCQVACGLECASAVLPKSPADKRQNEK